MLKTRFTFYKNAEYTAFLHFMSEKFAMTVSLKYCALLIKLLLQEKLLCINSSAEFPNTQVYEKRLWSDEYAESVKNHSEIRKGRFFYVQSGKSRKIIDSTVVEEVATAV